MNSVRSGLSLSLNQMAIPIYTVPKREDVDAGGQVLLHNFLQEEFVNEGLDEEVLSEVEFPPPDEFEDVGPDLYRSPIFRNNASAAAVTPDGYTSEEWITIGGTIRDLADQFKTSVEREEIRRQANQVDLTSINRISFDNMLNVIFRNGIDRYCIVALFYFCSDVLIRCIRQEMREQGSRLFLWSLRFLVDRVCSWVYEHGGWERVILDISNIAYKFFGIAAFCVIITCGFIWMRKNL